MPPNQTRPDQTLHSPLAPFFWALSQSHLQLAPRTAPPRSVSLPELILYFSSFPPLYPSLCRQLFFANSAAAFSGAHLSMEPTTKKRKLAPKVNASPAPNPQPAAAQYAHEPSVRAMKHPAANSHPLIKLPTNCSTNTMLSCHRANTLQPMMRRFPNDRTSSPLLDTSKMPPC